MECSRLGCGCGRFPLPTAGSVPAGSDIYRNPPVAPKGATAVEETEKTLAVLKLMRLVEKKRKARYEKRYARKNVGKVG